MAQTTVEPLPSARRALEWPRLATGLVAALTVLAIGLRLAAIHQSLFGGALIGDPFVSLRDLPGHVPIAIRAAVLARHLLDTTLANTS